MAPPSSVRAIEAGADVYSCRRTRGRRERSCWLFGHGRISQKRNRQSVRACWAAKIKLGLDRGRLVDLEGIVTWVNAPEANERAQSVATAR